LKNAAPFAAHHGEFLSGRIGARFRRRPPSMSGRQARRVFASFLSFLLIALAGPRGVNADSQADEYRVKAAFLFHFAQLIEWPPESLGDSTRPIVFCTERPDPFRGDLEAAVAGKRINLRAVRVEHVKNSGEARGCQLLFIGKSGLKDTPGILADLGTSPVVTVGEDPNFIQSGGIIGFNLEDNRIRFEINLTVAQRLRIKISSHLLGLASNVVGTAAEK